MPGNSTGRAAAEALFRHRSLFIAVAGLILVVTVLVIVFTPRTYVSEMNVLVRNARPDYLLSPERSNGQLTQNEVTEERVGSEMEVLKSRDLADVVVDPSWPKTPLSQRRDSEIRAHEKAVAEFSKHLTVESLRKSNMIRVAYVASTPMQATDTLDRLLEAFLAKQGEIERSTGASSFFGSEAARYKDDLDKAQQQLAAFQQNSQIISLPTREATIETQINLIEDSMRSAQVQVTEAANRVSSDRHQLAAQPDRQATMQKSVPNLEAIQQLTTMLATYQNKRTELVTRYQPSDRLVVEVNQQIANTTAALTAAKNSGGTESTTDVNPLSQQLKAQLSTSTSDLAALQGRLADLTAQRDRLKQQLHDVEASTVDYTTLQSRVAELESNYQLYTQKKNEAGIADAMNQQQLVNVAVAERPTFSDKRYRPQILLDLGLGLFTALFLASCAVFFAELARETVDAPWELEAISTAPVLATVPVVDQHLHGSFGRSAGGGSPPRRDGEPVPVAPVTPTSGGTAGFADAPQGTRQVTASPVLRKAAPVVNEREEKFERSKFTPVVNEVVMKSPEVRIPAIVPAKKVEAPKAVSAPPRDATVMRRAAVMGYEQLTAANAEAKRLKLAANLAAASAPPANLADPIARDPRAYPTSPARVAGAAKPIIKATDGNAVPVLATAAEAVEPQKVAMMSPTFDPAEAYLSPIEPQEPLPESRHRSVLRGPEPERSRLSPSQRAALQRADSKLDRDGRQAFVSYTADPRDRK